MAEGARGRPARAVRRRRRRQWRCQGVQARCSTDRTWQSTSMLWPPDTSSSSAGKANGLALTPGMRAMSECASMWCTGTTGTRCSAARVSAWLTPTCGARGRGKRTRLGTACGAVWRVLDGGAPRLVLVRVSSASNRLAAYQQRARCLHTHLAFAATGKAPPSPPSPPHPPAPSHLQAQRQARPHRDGHRRELRGLHARLGQARVHRARDGGGVRVARRVGLDAAPLLVHASLLSHRHHHHGTAVGARKKQLEQYLHLMDP